MTLRPVRARASATARPARECGGRAKGPIGRLLGRPVAARRRRCDWDWSAQPARLDRGGSRIASALSLACRRPREPGRLRRLRPRSSTSSPSSQCAASSSAGRSTAADEARSAAGSRPWPARISRAASLTASPITVYSKRSLAADVAGDDLAVGDPDPGLDALDLAVEALGQLAAGGQRGAGRVVDLLRRAEDRQGRVPLELVDPAAVLVDRPRRRPRRTR